VVIGGGLSATVCVLCNLPFGPAVAVKPYGQVFGAEGDHAATERTDGPLAPHPLLKVEADEDPQPKDKLADPVIGVHVAGQGPEVVDRGH
jgi:hypothetical protein